VSTGVAGRRTDTDAGAAADDDEDGQEGKLDRELIELLNELRVVLPGVQALFAFLLVVPFNNRFSEVSERERVVYIVALMASALACALFITVPSFHRLRFRRHDKEQLLVIGNRATIAGTALLAISMSAAVFLINELLFGAAAAIVGLWWVLPLRYGPRK
jgi:hypothetical protein